jgi:hypothetical protein
MASHRPQQDRPSAAPAAVTGEIEVEARRLIDSAWDVGIPARLLGGLAVAERVPVDLRVHFARTYGDIDLVIPRRASGDLVTLMERRGYVEDAEFNAMNGRTRLLFKDRERSRDVDVFIEQFELCHVIPLRLQEADRRGSRTLLLSDLMLTKLQIVKLTDKDLIDIAMLLMTYNVDGDDETGIDGEWIATLCAGNWGLWRTTSENLARVAGAVPRLEGPPRLLADAGTRAATLADLIEKKPKSTRWRVRSRVGERVRWYEEPDEK